MNTETNPWNPGFPRDIERQQNQIKFEVKIGDNVRNAYVFANELVWKDADNFDVIPRESVVGWREPTPKTCQYGNHPIDEVVERGLITYYTVKDGKTYACRNCDLQERIRNYSTTGILRTNLWTDAALRQQDREFILRVINTGEVGRLQQIVDYAKRIAKTLFKEEQAYNADRAEQYRKDIDNLLADGIIQAIRALANLDRPDPRFAAIGAGLLPLTSDPFKGAPRVARILALFGDEQRQFWFNRLCSEMESVTRIAEEWERTVWFGGEDRSQDPRYTEPYPNLGERHRQYLHAKSAVRADVLPPGSLQAFIIPAKFKSYKAVVGDVTYLSTTMCGRSVFQIENATSLVSFIANETSPSPRGGIQAIDARSEDAVMLFQQAIDDWKAGEIKLVHDKNVGFGI